jgi:hypothetical protein
MSATSKARRAARSLQLPRGAEDCEWVSDLLRSVADTEDIRRVIMGTLNVDDLWCIWRGTKDGATARDKRSHLSARLELERRGLLDAWGQPLPAAD